MITFIKSSIILTFLMMLVVGVYTGAVYGLGKILPNQGEGEQIIMNGERFYGNIAQQFKSPKYFHSRPSSVGYNAAGSGGSNKGSTNPEYLDLVQKRIDSMKAQNPEMGNVPVPVDLVTASASGFDPDISVKGAEYQIKRIAKIRSLDEEKIKNLVVQNTSTGIFGPSKVNVLKLNIALDHLK